MDADRTPAEIFSRIFRMNHWGSAESVSGRGSELRQTVEVRQAVASVLDRYEVHSVLDAGCGDLNWQRHVAGLLDRVEYLGIDIVGELIESGRRRFGSSRVRFQQLDVGTDAFPRADLIICRDCLVHLTNAEITMFLRHVGASGADYLLATTYPAEMINRDTRNAHWRPVNLAAPPFDLPAPKEWFDTDFRDGGRNHPGNGLGLWAVESIPVHRLGVTDA